VAVGHPAFARSAARCGRPPPVRSTARPLGGGRSVP